MFVHWEMFGEAKFATVSPVEVVIYPGFVKPMAPVLVLYVMGPVADKELREMKFEGFVAR